MVSSLYNGDEVFKVIFVLFLHLSICCLIRVLGDFCWWFINCSCGDSRDGNLAHGLGLPVALSVKSLSRPHSRLDLSCRAELEPTRMGCGQA